MDFNTIIAAVGSLGFPIVAAVMMAVFFNKMQESYRQDIKDLNREHKAESDKMVEAINNNTIVIQKLVDKMGDD
jgi:hypothetical protein